MTCCRTVGIKSPSVLMEINVVVCEPLSAVTQRGLGNKHVAERPTAPPYDFFFLYADGEGPQPPILMESSSGLSGSD